MSPVRPVSYSFYEGIILVPNSANSPILASPRKQLTEQELSAADKELLKGIKGSIDRLELPNDLGSKLKGMLEKLEKEAHNYFGPMPKIAFNSVLFVGSVHSIAVISKYLFRVAKCAFRFIP